ncbi:MAG: hypothetical protein WC748_05055 [Legionellales bacterium]|jgi:hypothetical protein
MMKKDKQKQQITKEQEPLIIPQGSSSIQGDLEESGNRGIDNVAVVTQGSENKDAPPPPTMLTLAKEGLSWFTAGQIFSAVANAGVGTMIAALAVEKLNDPNTSDDDAYATTLTAISIAAGIISVSITSYGFLRTEALRLRSKAREENIQEKVNSPSTSSGTSVPNESELEKKIAVQKEQLRDMKMLLEVSEERAKKAEQQLSSSSAAQLK